MSKVEEYRAQLTRLKNWRAFLLRNSGLPGPRGNLELAQAFAEIATLGHIQAFLAIPAEKAPENSAEVFLVLCAVAALGKRIAMGEHQHLTTLRPYASDGRWRVREAVAIGLQYVGEADMQFLLRTMQDWPRGNWYEQRAAAAALAEPRLLKRPSDVKAVLRLFDGITKKIAAAGSPQNESFKVLRQSMGYCWSVAVAALPEDGKRLIQKWLASPNADVRWIMRENLKKNRLEKMDSEWVKSCKLALGESDS